MCSEFADKCVKKARGKNLKTALATTPLFPAAAIEERVRWAGLDKNDFDIITTYENSSYAKPNPDYFINVAKKLDVKPEECLMAGNDTSDDLPCLEAGMDIFIVTDCLLNENNIDITNYKNGSLKDLYSYISSLK